MKTPLSPFASLIKGALMTTLGPRLAADLDPLLVGLTSKNFDWRKAGLIADLRTATRGKLANDKAIERVVDAVLDAGRQADDGDTTITDKAYADMLTWLKARLDPKDFTYFVAWLEDTESKLNMADPDNDEEPGKAGVKTGRLVNNLNKSGRGAAGVAADSASSFVLSGEAGFRQRFPRAGRPGQL